MIKNITILGSTGSIGVNTLDVIARHPQRYKVFALSAHSRVNELATQCLQFNPRYAVMNDSEQVQSLQKLLQSKGCDTAVLCGAENLSMIASHPDAHSVMAAIVGAAGLPPTLAAAQAGKTVMLANKEALVMSGALFMNAVKQHGATLLPIDSEHNALFQSLPRDYAQGLEKSGVRNIILTASGGPFRNTPIAHLQNITPDEACAHPNWVMGRKISVDSATMMNKGLEVIEARWLFDATPAQIEVVIHPQSIVHSMVSYRDGSVIAQLGNPDMRTPIAYALGFPERIEAGVDLLDLIKVGQLNFEAPDLKRFPCLQLAYDALQRGGTAPTVLNAANEIAVEYFLQGKLNFLSIARVIEQALSRASIAKADTLEAVMAADNATRRAVHAQLSQTKL